MQTTEISGARGIKTATGHTAIKTTLLKSKIGDVITDKTKQLEHWVEHQLELHATQNVVTDVTLSLPVVEELDNLPSY